MLVTTSSCWLQLVAVGYHQQLLVTTSSCWLQLVAVGYNQQLYVTTSSCWLPLVAVGYHQQLLITSSSCWLLLVAVGYHQQRLVEFLDYVDSSLDIKPNTIAVYLDFSKAFDRVIHEILISKLQNNGIRGSCRAGLSLIRVIGTNMSQSKTPAPLWQTLHQVFRKVRCWAQYFFFCISMTCIDLQTRCALFILLMIQQFLHQTNNVHATVNWELVRVDNWHKTNRVSLNVSETSYMIISNQKNALDIKIRESTVTKVSTVKSRGIIHNENLTFKDHENKVNNKTSKSVGVMRRLHCQLPANVMVKMYYSLLYSHLTYALLAWGRSGRTNAAKIECAHRRVYANYSQIITQRSSLFTQFMITLLY